MGLREQAKLDARAILEDLSGFAWPVTLVSPLGAVYSLSGLTTDVGQTIDPETGQAVAGRRASVALARGALPELPVAVPESSRKPWIATFVDSQGESGSWKVIEVLPDRAAGVVVLLLEAYARPTVYLTGSLVLPSLQLAGSIAPRVSLSGGLVLPSLQLAGSIAPRVSLSGGLVLPALQLAGSIAPRVSLSGGLVLPSLQLAGSISVQTPIVAGWLRLDSSAQSGGKWTSLADVINPGNPVIQATAGRRASVGASANGLPTMVWSGANVYVWPLSATIQNQTTKWGFWLWFKPATVAGVQRLINITIATGAAVGLEKLSIYTNNATLTCEIYRTNATGRTGTTASNVLTAGAWHSIYIQYDSSRGGDANLALYVNDVVAALNFSNIGIGATLAALQAPTGNALLGGFNNTDSPIQAIASGGQTGPNAFTYTENLGVSQRASFQTFEAPT